MAPIIGHCEHRGTEIVSVPLVVRNANHAFSLSRHCRRITDRLALDAGWRSVGDAVDRLIEAARRGYFNGGVVSMRGDTPVAIASNAIIEAALHDPFRPLSGKIWLPTCRPSANRQAPTKPGRSIRIELRPVKPEAAYRTYEEDYRYDANLLH